MRPEQAFTHRSRRRYKALRRITRRMVAPEGYVIIPGRKRRRKGRSDIVYVELMHRYTGAGRRFYFHSMPNRKEVEQIIRLLEMLERRRGSD